MKRATWVVMPRLATPVAAYSASVLLLPGLGPPFVRERLGEMPLTVIGHPGGAWLRWRSSCHRAMVADGRVLLVEAVLPFEDAPHFGKSVDVTMLAFTGGWNGPRRSIECSSTLPASC